MTSLFARLKSGTDRQHQEIEALIDPMKNFASMDAYKAHLLKTWMLYHPLEADLAKQDWPAVGINFASRRKTPLLERDLSALGVSCTDLNTGERTLERANLDFALGCLYVLEGATLGGQVISRHLAELGIGPENGGLFFHGYGPKTGEMWKSFQVTATAHCVTEDQIEKAVAGAKWTFDQFRNVVLTRQELIAHVA